MQLQGAPQPGYFGVSYIGSATGSVLGVIPGPTGPQGPPGPESYELQERQLYPSGSAPTITYALAAANSQITGTSISGPRRDVIASGSVSVFNACNLNHRSETYPYSDTYTPLCAQQNQFGDHAKGSYSLHFYSESPKVEIAYINRGGTSYRVWVDDMAVGSFIPVTAATSGQMESILIDSTSVGGVKIRRYRVDISGADFYGIILSSAVYSVWPAEQRGPTVFFMGDSLFDGSNMSTSVIEQIPEHVGNLFGWDNVLHLGRAGTGYVTKNAPSAFDNSALSQVQYVAPSIATPSASAPGSAMPVPEIVVFGYGHNDLMNATTYTAAGTTLAQARSQWPNAFIVVLGPLGNGIDGTTYSSAESNIFSAVAPSADATLSMWTGPARPWMYGTGRVGSTTGSSNGDIYIGSDSTHWTDAGIAYMAHRIARELNIILSV